MANNQLLFNWCQKFDSWRMSAQPEYFIHKKQIELFFTNHTMQIGFLNSAIEKMDNEYFVFKEGQMLIDNGTPVFKDITQREEYVTKLKELMERKIEIIAFGSRL